MNQQYFYIQDENNMFTFKDGIKKVGKDFYYNSTIYPERGYATEEIAQEAIKKLVLHNQAGNLGHSFKVVNEVDINQSYIIMESTTNTIVDANCFIKKSETDWLFIGSSIGYTDRRPISTYRKEKAVEVLETLQEYNQKLKAGLDFYISEYKDLSYHGEIVTKEIKVM